ncbi:MAG TPA: hypothetical protein VI488_03890 [Candidatus Angelobacter sp.]
MRTFARITSGCALLLFATLGSAQQVDLAAGGNTLFSTSNNTASLAYLAPPERGGLYPSASFDRIFKNGFGYGGEFTFRYKQAFYNDYQKYRPVLYDVNAVLAPHFNPFPARISKRTSTIFTAGVGGQTVLYYNPYGNCIYSSGCTTHLNSNHFLLHVSAGFNYRVWRNFFVRPEAHYYYIIHNTNDFHSNSVLRLGASVGYTFHTD